MTPSQRSFGRIARRRSALRALTLVEMVAAIALTAGTMAPALSVIREALKVSREATQRRLAAVYAVQTLENQMSIAMRTWTNGTTTGTFSADGHSSLRYSATRSDAAIDGGISNRLMSVRVYVYYDANGNAAYDSGEVRVDYRSKVSKLASYQNEQI